MKLHLDWSDYENAGQGDAYAGIPANGGDFARAVSVCIRDQHCLTTGKGVMCPSYRVTGDERQSPGGRVVVLKEALNGLFGDQPFDDARVLDALDLCVGCKGCKRECANQLDMAAIKIEARAQRRREPHMLRDSLFAGLPRWLRWRRVLRWLLQWRNRHLWVARLGERWLGIAARRRLPEPAAQPFLASAIDPAERASASGASTDHREVILFVDTYAREFAPEIAEAAHRVLTAAGYRVQILQPAPDDAEPDRPLCCGRTYLSYGRVDAARAEAQRVLDALWPAMVSGLPVVGLEPSCILSLRDEHLRLGLGEDARVLARQVWLLEEFIAREADKKRFALCFQALPIKALVHGHCHQKAVGAMKALRKVLRMVPELEFEFIEASCCGGAGAFAFEAEHADIAARMAEADLLPIVREAAVGTTIVANGFSCRHQIVEGSGRQARHLALLLSEALPAEAPPVLA